MITIVTCLVVLIILQIIILRSDDYEKFMGSVLLWVAGLILSTIICLFVTPYTGGLYRGYSHGTRDGYITKLSDSKGIIYKTIEGEMQIGVGEQASLQKPWEWSIPTFSTQLMARATELRGKKARIEYVEWLIISAPIGKSNYEVISITPLE